MPEKSLGQIDMMTKQYQAHTLKLKKIMFCSICFSKGDLTVVPAQGTHIPKSGCVIDPGSNICGDRTNIMQYINLPQLRV